MNWPNLKIMVTGGAGFLGRHIVTKLQESGCGQIFVPRFEDYDFRHPYDATLALDSFGPDIVIHLAATCGGIGANAHRPATFFYDNLIMGANLIDAAHKWGVNKFVQMGSACEYPGDAPVPTRETDLWKGYPDKTNAPYGVAKRALETMGRAYREQYGMNIIHLLMTNIYGPGDDFNLSTSHAIPAIIRQCIEAEAEGLASIKLWGSGRATRDLLYVKDAVEGILLATLYYNEPEPINLGSGREISISDLANLVGHITGYHGQFEWDTTKPDGQLHRVLDTSRAKRFGFTAKTTLEEGVARTAEWYKENLCGK